MLIHHLLITICVLKSFKVLHGLGSPLAAARLVRCKLGLLGIFCSVSCSSNRVRHFVCVGAYEEHTESLAVLCGFQFCSGDTAIFSGCLNERLACVGLFLGYLRHNGSSRASMFSSLAQLSFHEGASETHKGLTFAGEELRDSTDTGWAQPLYQEYLICVAEFPRDPA